MGAMSFVVVPLPVFLALRRFESTHKSVFRRYDPYRPSSGGLLQYPSLLWGRSLLGTAFSLLGPRLTGASVRLACWRRMSISNFTQ